MTKSKGKQAIPYLLSTTLSLKKSGRYFYKYFDFHFNCKRNRDCYTERNVRINMTRMWHNIIIPNAILCRESGFKPKFQDALDALNHAMTNGKTERSISMWKQICREEATLPKDKKVVYKYMRSFYYYVLGMAVNQKGLLYNLPKKKVITLDDYTKKLFKFIHSSFGKYWEWKCPWDGLNEMVYRWKHFEDGYNERQAARVKRMDELKSKCDKIWFCDDDAASKKAKIDAEIAKIDKEIDADDPPEWPSTLRELCKKFGVSMTTAKMFKDWMKQFARYDRDIYWDVVKSRKIQWALPKSENKNDDQTDDDFVDTSKINTDDNDDDDDEESVDSSIDRDIQAVENSGDRPVGSIDEDVYLPF